MSEEKRKEGVSLEDFFDFNDEDIDYKVKTKLEVIAEDLNYDSSGKLIATLIFHIKLYDNETEAYRDIYRKTINDVIIYDVNMFNSEDDLRLGRLERKLQNPKNLARRAISDYENFLNSKDSKYNEVDIDNKDSLLYDLYNSKKNLDSLPKILPIDFVNLIEKLYLSFIAYNPNN